MELLALLIEAAAILGEALLLAASLVYRRREPSATANWLVVGAAGQFAILGLGRLLGVALAPSLVQAVGGETATTISLGIAAAGSAFALVFASSLFRLLAGPRTSASV